MQDIVIARPDASALAAEAAPLVRAASSLKIATKDDHERALESIKVLRGFEKRIIDAFEPTRKNLDGAKKELLALRDGMLRPISSARATIDTTAAAYETEQRRIAEAETKRLMEEARKREEERQLEQAVEAEEAGDPELADEILREPTPLPVVHVAAAVAKVDGMSTQTRWGAEVVDLLALVRYVAANPQWVNLLEANTVALNRLAVAVKGELRIPGVRAVSTTHRVARGA
jgi:hypothetical protein